jgi:hypothetical protein
MADRNDLTLDQMWMLADFLSYAIARYKKDVVTENPDLPQVEEYYNRILRNYKDLKLALIQENWNERKKAT